MSNLPDIFGTGKKPFAPWRPFWTRRPLFLRGHGAEADAQTCPYVSNCAIAFRRYCFSSDGSQSVTGGLGAIVKWIRQQLPAELEKVARMGRAENLELLTATQHPRDYHRDLRAEVTEWVCFQTTEPGDLDAVRPYFSGVDCVTALARGSFISYNRESSAELWGKIF
jgi:hypothetical protein